jgi:ankyrin repeat protein
MNNIWEMASSAPTSVVTDEARSRITKFFFMIPSDEQVEQVLCLHCQRASASAVKLILEKVVSPNKKLKQRQFFRPLIYAVKGASSKHNKCARQLLAAGVNPNHKSHKTGLTPLHIALSHPNFKGYTNLIWLLLSNEPKADPNAPDWHSERPLEKLFIGPDTQPLELHKRGALSMLLREGADPNFKLPGTGDTPLHLAVRRQDPVVAAMLLYKGADVNAKNNSGSTPLQITANQFRRELSADHAEVLDHLLQYKADVDEPAGALRRTALHWACIAGCAQAVTSLLDAGADVAKTDTDGRDALGLAIENANKLTATASGGDMNGAGLSDHVEIMVGLVGKIRNPLKLEQGRCALETAIKGNDRLLLSMLLPSRHALKLSFRNANVRDLIEREGSEMARALLSRYLR